MINLPSGTHESFALCVFADGSELYVKVDIPGQMTNAKELHNYWLSSTGSQRLTLDSAQIDACVDAVKELGDGSPEVICMSPFATLLFPMLVETEVSYEELQWAQCIFVLYVPLKCTTDAFRGTAERKPFRVMTSTPKASLVA